MGTQKKSAARALQKPAMQSLKQDHFEWNLPLPDKFLQHVK
jgi:hypothetical protein